MIPNLIVWLTTDRRNNGSDLDLDLIRLDLIRFWLGSNSGSNSDANSSKKNTIVKSSTITDKKNKANKEK
jgi:hypothetical protein